MKAIVHCWVGRLTHPSWWFNRTDAIALFDSYNEGVIHINDATGEGYAHHIRNAGANSDANAAGVFTVETGQVEPMTEATLRVAVETLNRRREGDAR